MLLFGAFYHQFAVFQFAGVGLKEALEKGKTKVVIGFPTISHVVDKKWATAIYNVTVQTKTKKLMSQQIL